MLVIDVVEQVVRTAVKAPRRIPKMRINPDGRVMRRFERVGSERLARALNQLRARLFRGVGDENMADLIHKLDDPEIVRALQDDLAALVNEWALAGSDFGRDQIEAVVFGVSKRVGDAGFGIDWELANVQAVQWAGDHVGNLVRDITRTTKERLRREVSQFADSGETFQQFSRRLAQSGLFSPERARMIAVTEVTSAFAQGNMIAWKESGVTEGKEWNTANDELVCPICGPLDGKQVKLDGEFTGGFAAPPAHPRCRCWITPVTMGDLQTGEQVREGLFAPPPPIEEIIPTEALAFDRATAANKWGKQNYGEWQKGLGADARYVKGYQTTEYRWINQELRTGVGINDESLEWHRKLDEIINSAPPLADDLIVHRGMSLESLGVSRDELLGAVIEDKGYTSTSLVNTEAGRFASWSEENNETPLLTRIQLPAGTRGAYVEGVVDIKEYEFLLARGSRFEITEVGEESVTVYGERRTFTSIVMRLLR